MKTQNSHIFGAIAQIIMTPRRVGNAVLDSPPVSLSTYHVSLVLPLDSIMSDRVDDTEEPVSRLTERQRTDRETDRIRQGDLSIYLSIYLF